MDTKTAHRTVREVGYRGVDNYPYTTQDCMGWIRALRNLTNNLAVQHKKLSDEVYRLKWRIQDLEDENRLLRGNPRNSKV